MNNIKNIVIFIVLMVSFQVRAEILETQDASVIRDKIAELKIGDMALFDVKHVLFHSMDQVMSHEHKSFVKEKFIQIEQDLGKEEAMRLGSIVLNSYRPVVVDHEIPDIINQAQQKGIIIFALTSGYASDYGIIENRADLRIKSIKDMGIDFSKSKSLPSIDLSKGNKLSEGDNDSNPLFQEGVIFASKIPKGEILGRFLKATKLKPKKIVFVDNQIRNVMLVEEKCKELGIEYIGVHFTKLYKKAYDDLETEVAEKKFEVLLSEDKWISDDEARLIIKK